MLYPYLPYFIFKRLYGDRRKYGSRVDYSDPEFKIWKDKYFEFYKNYCEKGIGHFINHSGFKIINKLKFNSKIVLEVGPGLVDHVNYIKEREQIKQYLLADINDSFLEKSEDLLKNSGIPEVSKIKIEGRLFPLEDNSVDIVLSFSQLEHVEYLEGYLKELKRVLKPGGFIAGSIPAEGGLVWGLGRFFLSRGQVINRLKLDYDKIICWEHQNFADKIIKNLDLEFQRIVATKKPLPFLPLDLCISWSFIYKNEKTW